MPRWTRWKPSGKKSRLLRRMRRMIRFLRAVAIVATVFILSVTSIATHAQAPRGQGAAPANTQPTRTVQDGVFSEAQATRGQAVYAQRCAGCHGPALEGASGPALVGERFTNRFRMEPLSALFIQIRYAMPPR